MSAEQQWSQFVRGRVMNHYGIAPDVIDDALYTRLNAQELARSYPIQMIDINIVDRTTNTQLFVIRVLETAFAIEVLHDIISIYRPDGVHTVPAHALRMFVAGGEITELYRIIALYGLYRRQPNNTIWISIVGAPVPQPTLTIRVRNLNYDDRPKTFEGDLENAPLMFELTCGPATTMKHIAFEISQRLYDVRSFDRIRLIIPSGVVRQLNRTLRDYNLIDHSCIWVWQMAAGDVPDYYPTM